MEILRQTRPVLLPNRGKSLEIIADGAEYQRLPIHTHVITESDDIIEVVSQYASEYVQDETDVIFVSEKAVACSQGRAIPVKEIHPRPLARLLCRFVYKPSYGLGLSVPCTMEMALRECGTLRILLAAFVSAVGKLLGKRGWFYMVAGDKAAAIDGPTVYTIPPYNEYVVLAPLEPDRVAAEISERTGCRVCIVDINDIGGKILGVSHADMREERLVKILKDNPLGQAGQQTPFGIIRRFA